MKREEDNEERERENKEDHVAARWGEGKRKNATSAGMLRWCHEPPKKVVPVFECGKRSCHYLMITLNVVPLYDVNPNLKD